MKNNFLTLFLFFIMIILIAGIAILGGAIYIDLFSDSTEPIVYQTENIITEEVSDRKKEKIQIANIDLSESIQSLNSTNEEKSSKKVDLQNQQTNNRYFYDQLSNNQKIIYDELNNNKINLRQGNYIIKYGDKFSELLSKEDGSKQLGDDYQTAIEAFTHDNPDLFFLDVNKMYLNIETTTKFLKTTYDVYISPSNNSTYLSEDFSSINQIEDGFAKIEKVKNAILNRLTGSDYQKVLYIHDYLVSTIEYDSTYSSIGTYSIYGALVGKTCVCEGYAKAFKYLANAAGFNSEIMQGVATNSSGQSENHAWNCIEIGGVWYEIDPTWDDPIIVGGNGKLTNEMKYKYFLKGRTTFEKDHVLSYQFSSEGKKFSYPTISKSDY